MERERKCWGNRTVIYRNSSSEIALLELERGTRCSWHHHNQKWNRFFVVNGCVHIATKDGMVTLRDGESLTVAPGVEHEFRVECDSTMIEAMYVEYDHSDIIRQDVGGDWVPLGIENCDSDCCKL